MTAQPVCLFSLNTTAKGWSTSVATGEQLKALVKSYIDGDEARFFTLALQVAAHEARRGHGKLAQEIRELIDWARAAASHAESTKKPMPIVHPPWRIGEFILGVVSESCAYPTWSWRSRHRRGWHVSCASNGLGTNSEAPRLQP